jgi:toxin secretion/phage lysis holin
MELIANAIASFHSMPLVAQLLVVLVAMQGLDVITGVLVAYHTRTLSSKLSWRGLVRKALTLHAVAIAATLELVLPHLPVPGALLIVPVIVGFILSETLSNLENLARAGVISPALFEFAEGWRAAIGSRTTVAQTQTTTVALPPGGSVETTSERS